MSIFSPFPGNYERPVPQIRRLSNGTVLAAAREDICPLMMNSTDGTMNVLLADDDQDDRFLFDLALKDVHLSINLSTVNNGEKLMEFLHSDTHPLPDVLFLDLNMPLKNGKECLYEIKNCEEIKGIPVIIYSTSVRMEVAEELYVQGAHYFLQKTDLGALAAPLQKVLQLAKQGSMKRPAWDDFVLAPSFSKFGKPIW